MNTTDALNKAYQMSMDATTFARAFIAEYEDFIKIEQQDDGNGWAVVSMKDIGTIKSGDAIPMVVLKPMMLGVIERHIQKASLKADKPHNYMQSQRGRCANSKTVSDALKMVPVVSAMGDMGIQSGLQDHEEDSLYNKA